MWPDWVSNLGPLALESDALPTALCSLAILSYRPAQNETVQILW